MTTATSHPLIEPQPIKKPKLVQLDLSLLRVAHWPVTFGRREAGRGRIESAQFQSITVEK